MREIDRQRERGGRDCGCPVAWYSMACLDSKIANSSVLAFHLVRDMISCLFDCCCFCFLFVCFPVFMLCMPVQIFISQVLRYFLVSVLHLPIEALGLDTYAIISTSVWLQGISILVLLPMQLMLCPGSLFPCPVEYFNLFDCAYDRFSDLSCFAFLNLF